MTGSKANAGIAALLTAPLILLLAFLAVSSTVSSLFARPDFSAKLDAREKVTAAEALDAANAEQRAAAWFEPARHNRAAARALLALPAAQRAAHFPQVGSLTESALSRSPMAAYDWTLMSFLALGRGDLAAANSAWQTSILFAPYAPELMRARIELGIRIARRDPGIEPALRDQVRLMANDPDGLAKMAREDGLEPYVRSVLRNEPKLRTNFENATFRLVAAAMARMKKP